MKKSTLSKKIARGERGAILISVLVFIALGAIILGPVLNYIGTGLISGQLFQDKADEYYAADAGIEDALWQFRNDTLDNILSLNELGVPTTYDRYDYITNWVYKMDGVNQVNVLDVDVTIGNEWMPYIDAPQNPNDARAVIEGEGTNPPIMIVSGKIIGSQNDGDGNPNTIRYVYQITLACEQDPLLRVTSIGVWLPSGFYYVDNSISLASDPVITSRPTSENKYDHKGSLDGAVVWDFSNLLFKDLRGVVDLNDPMVCKIEILVDTTDPTRSLETVPWIVTNTDLGGGLNYAWDGDVNVFRINSSAGTTEVDAYAIQSKLRDLNSALNGDYVAIGDSLMDYSGSGTRIATSLNSESENTILSSIPTNATIQQAYLYWAGWLSADTGGSPAVPNSDGPKVGTWGASVSSSNTVWLSPTANQAATGGDNNGFEINPTRAHADNPTDGSYATNNNGTGDRHIFSGYDTSSIPSGRTIQGIEVRLDWWLNSTSGDNTMSVELSWNNGANWTSLKDAPESSSTANSFILGGSGDTWGHQPWTLAELNSSNFRVRITCTSANSSTSSSRDFFLDWVPVRIHYAEAGSPSFYSLVDEISPANDLDYIVGETTTGGNASVLFDFEDYLIPSGSNIYSVTVNIRASDVGTGDASIAGSIVVDGTTYIHEFDDTPSGSFTDYDYVWHFNPATQAAWTVADINGIGPHPIEQFGVYSDDLSPDVRISSIYAEVNWRVPDNSITFTINNGSSHIITADLSDPKEVQSQLRLDPTDGFYYGCRVDVTNLIKTESNGANLGASPVVYGNGNGAYKAGNINGDIDNSASFAAWSLVIVYSSPETKGHLLFLYDLQETFSSVPAREPTTLGPMIQTMQMSGFLVPQRITDPMTGIQETVVARMTVFVGEGDEGIEGDYVAFIAQDDPTERKLWDGNSAPNVDNNTQVSPNNVWNGYSSGGVAREGVDIDTFPIYWAAGWLETGDTSAQIKLYTNGDGWVVIYKIISFRSSVTAGGAITYLIR